MEQSDNIDPRIVEQIISVDNLILNRSLETGVHETLMQITEKYGEIISATGENYTEIALSYLNLFDKKTQDIILQSIWFRTMIAYKVPVHILYEELQHIQEAIKIEGSAIGFLRNLENLTTYIMENFLQKEYLQLLKEENLPSSLAYFKPVNREMNGLAVLMSATVLKMQVISEK